MQKTYLVLETKLPYELDQKILKLMIAISYKKVSIIRYS